MDKIKTASHRFRVFFQTIFYLAPVAVAFFWLNFNSIYSLVPNISVAMNEPALMPTLSNGLPLSIRCAAFIVSLLPTAIFMLGAYYLIQLFRLYEQGKLFTLQNAHYIRKLGITFFAWVIIGFPYEALLSFIVSLHNAPGKHLISVGIGSPDITAIITGSLVLLLSWIMQEGYKLQEEHAYTV
jgi:hypothetical protein